MNETVTIPSEAARNADASVSRLRWSRPSVIDVLCVAGYGITRFGWGMQTHRPAVRQVIGRRRQCALAWAERRGRGAAGRTVPSTGAGRPHRPAVAR